VSETRTSQAANESERDVVRCKVCGLVQYRTRTGGCRRCLRTLPPPMEVLLPPPAAQDLPGDDRQLFDQWQNQDTVTNIGQRIRQLRESRGMTQSQLQARSRVSRSYLSRIESGQMTPSLGTLEKISEALGVGLSRFFVPQSNGEALMEDPFIQGLRPFLRQLDGEQWQWILKRLEAITDHVTERASTPGRKIAPAGRPAGTGGLRPVAVMPNPSPTPVPHVAPMQRHPRTAVAASLGGTRTAAKAHPAQLTRRSAGGHANAQR
jgi:transcriptional regulator with XRE-family HTH domain